MYVLWKNNINLHVFLFITFTITENTHGEYSTFATKCVYHLEHDQQVFIPSLYPSHNNKKTIREQKSQHEIEMSSFTTRTHTHLLFHQEAGDNSVVTPHRAKTLHRDKEKQTKPKTHTTDPKILTLNKNPFHYCPQPFPPINSKKTPFFFQEN